MGSYWSGVCHRPLELPPHVADMNSTVTQLSALSSPGTAPPFLMLVHCNVLCATLSMYFPMAAPVVSSAGVPSTGHGQHSGAEACHGATYTRLSALLFAEICAEASLPPGRWGDSAANEHTSPADVMLWLYAAGVFNVVTGPGSFGQMIATYLEWTKSA